MNLYIYLKGLQLEELSLLVHEGSCTAVYALSTCGKCPPLHLCCIVSSRRFLPVHLPRDITKLRILNQGASEDAAVTGVNVHGLLCLMRSCVVYISPPVISYANPVPVATQVTIDQVIGGARGIKSMIWETSNLDADEV